MGQRHHPLGLPAPCSTSTTVSKEVTVTTGPTHAAAAAWRRVSTATTSAVTAPTCRAARIPATTSPARCGPVQEQDVDQLAGAVGVAVDAAGGDPEVLVRGREHAGCSRLGQGGRPGQGAGLEREDLEVVVEVDDRAGAGDPPRVVRDQRSAVEHLHLGGLQRDPHAAADEAGGDGVLHHPHRD
jgi:hypothetical protein